MRRAESFWTVFGMALCLMKNYDPFQSPTHFKLMDLLKKFDKNFNATGKNYGKVGPDRTIDDVMKRRQDRWNFLFIAGMWFQDLFNYDFRRTEQCIIPYATQEGEISFCAYNTGVGWRNIIEKMHMTATLTKWYEEHGRHEIFAGGKNVKMEDVEHALVLHEEIVTNEVQHDLDKLGIAKTAREEKTRARDAKQKRRSGRAQRAHGGAVSRSRAERKTSRGRRRIHSAGVVNFNRGQCEWRHRAGSETDGEGRRSRDGCGRLGFSSQLPVASFYRRPPRGGLFDVQRILKTLRVSEKSPNCSRGWSFDLHPNLNSCHLERSGFIRIRMNPRSRKTPCSPPSSSSPSRNS